MIYFFTEQEAFMAEISPINENNFEDKVVKSSKLTVVDFYAEWCGPCRKMSEVLAQLGDDFLAS